MKHRDYIGHSFIQFHKVSTLHNVAQPAIRSALVQGSPKFLAYNIILEHTALRDPLVGIANSHSQLKHGDGIQYT